MSRLYFPRTSIQSTLFRFKNQVRKKSVLFGFKNLDSKKKFCSGSRIEFQSTLFGIKTQDSEKCFVRDRESGQDREHLSFVQDRDRESTSDINDLSVFWSESRIWVKRSDRGNLWDLE